MAEQSITVIPNLSIDTLDSSGSAPSFSISTRATFTLQGQLSSSGTLAQTGPATFASSVSLGVNGQSIVGLRRSTVSVALGTVAFDSVTTSLTISGITVGDPIIGIVPASLWSGAYRDISLDAIATAGDTVLLGARNSTLTGINTTAMNFTVHWLDLA
jgi:hypothetical protein